MFFPSWFARTWSAGGKQRMELRVRVVKAGKCGMHVGGVVGVSRVIGSTWDSDTDGICLRERSACLNFLGRYFDALCELRIQTRWCLVYMPVHCDRAIKSDVWLSNFDVGEVRRP